MLLAALACVALAGCASDGELAAQDNQRISQGLENLGTSLVNMGNAVYPGRQVRTTQDDDDAWWANYAARQRQLQQQALQQQQDQMQDLQNRMYMNELQGHNNAAAALRQCYVAPWSCQ
jgi:hypothetical protein